ncbi:MAG: hypothetical protein ACI8TQ_002639 [Planctomycetota bacterium]|jgi:hypothetical protein
MTTSAEFRDLALTLLEAESHPHRERESFRVRKKIFATLAEADGIVVLKLEVEHQQQLVNSTPSTFMLVGWEKQGWTGLSLSKISHKDLQALLITAWRNVAPAKLIKDFDNVK